jgi:hypothetical protein
MSLDLQNPQAFTHGQARNPSYGLLIGVDKLIYQLDEVSRLEIFFAVFNDGDATIDPGIGSSHLLINGVEAKCWSLIVANGPLGSIEFNALPPGHPYLFRKQLGSVYFGELESTRFGGEWEPSRRLR